MKVVGCARRVENIQELADSLRQERGKVKKSLNHSTILRCDRSADYSNSCKFHAGTTWVVMSILDCPDPASFIQITNVQCTLAS